MSFRSKITLLLVAVTAAATLLVGLLAVRATSQQLYRELDQSLVQLANPRVLNQLERHGTIGGGPGRDEDDLGGSPYDVVYQTVTGGGDVQLLYGSEAVPVPAGAARAAASGDAAFWTTTLSAVPYRSYITPVDGDLALVVALSAAEQQRILRGLAWRIALIGLAVTALAALAGWYGAGALVRPLRRLTEAAEEVAESGDLAVDVRTEAPDEAGRLSRSFDEMLTSLAAAREAQQRLVQDAGHELRTPIASIMSNAEVLDRHRDLDADTRSRIARDLISESRELATLVNSLVDLASVTETGEEREPVGVTDLVAAAMRALPHQESARVLVSGDATVLARPRQLQRAVVNLLTNAVKFDPTGAPVEVTVRHQGAVTDICVRDHGPGIDEVDLPHVAARFYRSDSARAVPGSGLGLAIVEDIARSNGGSLSLSNHPEGGAVACLHLPSAPRTIHLAVRPSGSPR